MLMLVQLHLIYALRHSIKFPSSGHNCRPRNTHQTATLSQALGRHIMMRTVCVCRCVLRRSVVKQNQQAVDAIANFGARYKRINIFTAHMLFVLLYCFASSLNSGKGVGVRWWEGEGREGVLC